jgi:hypothetical protein
MSARRDTNSIAPNRGNLMRRMMVIAATAVAVLAGPLSARQVPSLPKGLGQVPVQAPEILDPNPKKVHGCLRPDVATGKAQIQSALDEARKSGGTPVEVQVVQKNVAGCEYYKITLDSKIQIDDTENPGLTSTISGRGNITFGLTRDNSEPGYDLTSGVQDLTAPFEWTAGSAEITRPRCEVTITPLPYTLFAFWLGVRNSNVSVRITPEGNELHPIETRCQDDLGRWSKRFPGKEAIFSPAWIKLHGEGKVAAPQSADQKEMIKATNALGQGGIVAPPKLSSPTGDGLDMGKLMAMANDPNKMAELQKLNPNDPADMAKLKNLMSGVVPNANAQLAAALDNFMFDCPPVPGAPNRWECRITHNAKKMSDRLGYGTIKAISEQTVITIEKVRTPPGGP